jgi:DNA-binding protein H-NS
MSTDDSAFPTSFEGMNLAQLEALREDMDATLKRLEREERQAALQQIHTLIEQFRFLPFEVFPRKAEEPKAKLPAKYYDPDSGQSWSGRGKPPRWIQGKDPRQFLIQKEGILAAMENAGLLKPGQPAPDADD